MPAVPGESPEIYEDFQFHIFENGLPKMVNGEPVYADNGGDRARVAREREIILSAMTGMLLNLHHHIYDDGNEPRIINGQPVYADNGGSSDQVQQEKADILMWLALKEKMAQSKGKVNSFSRRIRNMMAGLLGKAT